MAQTNRRKKVRETRQQGEKQDEGDRDEPGGPGQRRKEKVKTCRQLETSRKRDFFCFFKDLRDSCFARLSTSCSSSTHYRAAEPSPVPLISSPRAAQHLAVVITPDPDKQVAVTIGSESHVEKLKTGVCGRFGDSTQML